MQAIDNARLDALRPAAILSTVGSVGENVIRIRRRTKMSQKALAARLGMTQPSVWKIEKGTTDTSGVELGTLLKLAKALGCEVEDLVVGVDAAYDIWRRDLPDHGGKRPSHVAHSQPQQGGQIEPTTSSAQARILAEEIKGYASVAESLRRSLQDAARRLDRDVAGAKTDSSPGKAGDAKTDRLRGRRKAS